MDVFNLNSLSNPGNLAIFAILVLVDLAYRVLAILFVPRNRRPMTALAWLMAIFLIPYVGLIAFIVFGSNKLPKRRRRKQAQINEIIHHSTDGMDEISVSNVGPDWVESIIRMNRELGAVPMIGGNQATLQGSYEETIAAMAAEIDSAQRYVHLEFYILARDRTTEVLFQAIERAQSRGIEVRVLLDHVASVRIKGFRKNTLPSLKRITEQGGQWSYMLPVRPWRGQYQRPDLRNHRKLLVVDGISAFLGSQNVIDASYNKRANVRKGLHWHDLMVRVSGPTVLAVDAIFITDWYSETDELLDPDALLSQQVGTALDDLRDDGATVDCQVVPSGPGFEGENNLRLFLALLYGAQHEIILTSPYFVPDDAMLYAITSATRRGVRVELFVSETGDQVMVYHAQRSYYQVLLEAGVKIWMYRTPTILHAKHFTIDNNIAVIGSSNMDMRSFSLNLEVSLMVRGVEFTTQLHGVQQQYREHSRELTLEEWNQQPLKSQLLDSLCRLTSGLQ